MAGERLILAVDAGNTRIKWALHDGRGFVRDGWCSVADASDLKRDWSALPAPDRVVVANVAGDAAAAAILAAARLWPRDVRFVTAQAKQCGITSLYANPAQLGADRWAALIATRRLGDAPHLVVCCGTAVTIDALLGNGTFLGGLILPGLAAMHDALAASTAGLSADKGEFRSFPRSTRDAISSGAIHAICGAIERMRGDLAAEARSEPAIVVSGGGAELIARHLHRPVQIRERLVLEGLVRLAGAEP
jgi:type III pantothenate kinase